MQYKHLITCVFIITICLKIIFCKGENRIAEPHLRFDCEVVNKNDSQLTVKVSLTNMNNKQQSYWTMTCDTLHEYVVDSKDWALPRIICEYNATIKKLFLPMVV